MSELYLSHHGIEGQKWGDRNGPPYPLDSSQYSKKEIRAAIRAHKKIEKKDVKWARKNNDKIYKKAYDASKSELETYVQELNQKYRLNANGKVSAAFINDFNRKMANLMSQKVTDLSAPSGKVVTFVAKRGDVGVYMALADQGYDMSNVRNGVWTSGRIAYRKTKLDKVE